MRTLISPLFLNTFRKAYELKNFTSTAKALGLTQSGVSQHIGRIEELIGAPLFERVGRGLFPTRSADQLYTFGGLWLSQMEDFMQKIHDGEQNLSGPIVFGAPGSFGSFLLKPLSAWQNKNPGITIEFEYGPNSTLETALRSGRMDLAITSAPLDSRHYIHEECFTQEYVLVSHPNLDPKLESWESFCTNPFVDYVGSENIFQKWIGAHYKKHTLSTSNLNIRTKINNMEGIFFLLQQKAGFTIFPSEPLIEHIDKKKLKIHKTSKTVTNPLYIVQRQGQILPNRTQALRSFILELIAETEQLKR